MNQTKHLKMYEIKKTKTKTNWFIHLTIFLISKPIGDQNNNMSLKNVNNNLYPLHVSQCLHIYSRKLVKWPFTKINYI